MIHQIDSKNEWLLLSGSFTAKFGLVFVLNWKTLFLRGFIVKPIERAKILLRKSARDFRNSLPFKRSACFYVAISENFERFQYFNFETDKQNGEYKMDLSQRTEFSQ